MDNRVENEAISSARGVVFPTAIALLVTKNYSQNLFLGFVAFVLVLLLIWVQEAGDHWKDPFKERWVSKFWFWLFANLVFVLGTAGHSFIFGSEARGISLVLVLFVSFFVVVKIFVIAYEEKGTEPN